MPKKNASKRRARVTGVSRKVVVSASEAASEVVTPVLAPPRALLELDITRPLAGDLVRVDNHATRVSVFNNAGGFSEVWVKVIGASEIPELPSDGSVPFGAALLVNYGGGFYSGAAPVATNEDNMQIVAWARRPSDHAWTRPTIVAVRRAVPLITNVDSTSCLWFSWSPDGAVGPWGEPVAGHRPLSVSVPAGANQLSLTAFGAWRHDPSDFAASGPEGRDLVGPVKPGYRAMAPGIEPLPAAESRLNQLVGMWTFVGAGETEVRSGRELAIGASRTLVIPNSHSEPLAAGVARFYLAFHDDYQWNNNSGNVQVEMVFYTER